MRRLLVALALISACGTATSPSPSLAGRWAENISIPGARLVLVLDAAGNGSGTYAIEAGRSGVLQVRASGAASSVTLVLQYDYGLTRTFRGGLTDANHLTGVFNEGPPTVVFTRQ